MTASERARCVDTFAEAKSTPRLEDYFPLRGNVDAALPFPSLINNFRAAKRRTRSKETRWASVERACARGPPPSPPPLAANARVTRTITSASALLAGNSGETLSNTGLTGGERRKGVKRREGERGGRQVRITAETIQAGASRHRLSIDLNKIIIVEV